MVIPLLSVYPVHLYTLCIIENKCITVVSIQNPTFLFSKLSKGKLREHA